MLPINGGQKVLTCLLYLGMYLNVVPLLQFMNIQLKEHSLSRTAVLIFGERWNPSNTSNYFVKYNLVMISIYTTIGVIDSALDKTNNTIPQVVFNVSMNIVTITISVYSITAAMQFKTHILNKSYKKVATLQVALTVVNCVTIIIVDCAYIICYILVTVSFIT